MTGTPNQASRDRRRAERATGPRTVKVRLRDCQLTGSAENVSQSGLYMLARSAIPVEVELPGATTARAGTLIRVESVRDGEIGLAIRLDPTE